MNNKFVLIHDANVTEGKDDVLININHIVSVKLSEQGLLLISLSNEDWYATYDFCTEENPLMAFWKYISERE